jgi:hypothetical protein
VLRDQIELFYPSRKGDPKGWSAVLITALGSWQKLVPPAANTSEIPNWYSLTAALWAQLASVADGRICPLLGVPTETN